MAVDGTDPDDLCEILTAEVEAKKALGQGRRQASATDAGGYAPTIGIIGTVVGLVHVLENLSDPSKLGHLIAGAFVATLWGVMSANIMLLPVRQADHGRRGERGRPDGARHRGRPRRSRPAPTRGWSATKLRSKMQPAGARRRPRRRRERGQRRGHGRRGGHDEEHEEHENHERWLVSYADMMTLLMVLFIVMFAISSINQGKFDQLKQGLHNGFGTPQTMLAGRQQPARRRAAPSRPTRPQVDGLTQGGAGGVDVNSWKGATPSQVAELVNATQQAQVRQEVENLQEGRGGAQGRPGAGGRTRTARRSASTSAGSSSRSPPTRCCSTAPAPRLRRQGRRHPRRDRRRPWRSCRTG